jgi:DNA polymerase gamma 1
MELIEKQIWDGGTESEMFNRLEEIAQMECPATPILHCCISRSLVPSMVQNDVRN